VVVVSGGPLVEDVVVEVDGARAVDIMAVDRWMVATEEDEAVVDTTEEAVAPRVGATTDKMTLGPTEGVVDTVEGTGGANNSLPRDTNQEEDTK